MSPVRSTFVDTKRAGAGAGPTASAIVADIIDIARDEYGPAFAMPVDSLDAAPVADAGARVGKHYVRLIVEDRIGVLAEIAAAMRDAGGGSIINVSSAGALRPRPQIAPYAGAKAALNALTEAFAFEYGPKVRVNTISPGRFLTDVSKAWPEEHKANPTAALKRSGGSPIGSSVSLKVPQCIATALRQPLSTKASTASSGFMCIACMMSRGSYAPIGIMPKSMGPKRSPISRKASQ